MPAILIARADQLGADVVAVVPTKASSSSSRASPIDCSRRFGSLARARCSRRTTAGGVSGGSFTALAYGLHGEKLFDDYDRRFLKRDVEGELLARVLSPANWGQLWSAEWGRSELAAQLYDEILFEGATFADLGSRPGPLIVATATDISTGSRLGFTQSDFDLLCSDVDTVPLSRAAAASSAVPLVLSPVTVNNYGGTCGFHHIGTRPCSSSRSS